MSISYFLDEDRIYVRTDWREMKESDKYLELLEEMLKKYKEAK